MARFLVRLIFVLITCLSMMAAHRAYREHLWGTFVGMLILTVMLLVGLFEREDTSYRSKGSWWGG